ncbi:hypothetical protein [Lonepinella sp. BR2882]|uniref:hypothetical protein n=1 Tax=Lonepinella sp. BR2882 TaxID=3095283 RepID=UPI003F6DCF18
MNELEFITKLLQRTLEGTLHWENSQPDKILYSHSEIKIISCYKSTFPSGENLYLFKYREQEYHGEHDTYYYVTKVALSLVKDNQITWNSSSDFKIIHDLFDSVSYQYSGISNIANSL